MQPSLVMRYVLNDKLLLFSQDKKVRDTVEWNINYLKNSVKKSDLHLDKDQSDGHFFPLEGRED